MTVYPPCIKNGVPCPKADKPSCRDRCPEYIAWQVEHARLKAAERKRNAFTEYIISERCKKHRGHNMTAAFARGKRPLYE